MATALAPAVVMTGLARPTEEAVASGDTRSLNMIHLHTGESINIVYKRNGSYDSAALKKIDWFLRDWRQNQAVRIDPRVLDTLWLVYRTVGASQPINIVCGYRSPGTNGMLRRRSSGVAKFSQHTLGKAIDYSIPGVPLSKLRVAGLRLQRGGVGFYPTSGSPFVHMDAGNVRMWPRMSRSELASVFPDGKTVLLPSDGRRMPGYQVAMNEIRRNGSVVGGQSGGEDDAGDSGGVVSALFGSRSNSNDAPLPAVAQHNRGEFAAADAGPRLISQAGSDGFPGEMVSDVPLPPVRPGSNGEDGQSAPQHMATREDQVGTPLPASRPAVNNKPPIFADLSQGSEGVRKRSVASRYQRAIGYADLTPVTTAARPLHPTLIATRFERQNFASLSSPISAARNKQQAILVKPDLATTVSLISPPSRTIVISFSVVAYQDLRTDKFTGTAVKPLRTASFASTSDIVTDSIDSSN